MEQLEPRLALAYTTAVAFPPTVTTFYAEDGLDQKALFLIENRLNGRVPTEDRTNVTLRGAFGVPGVSEDSSVTVTEEIDANANTLDMRLRNLATLRGDGTATIRNTGVDANFDVRFRDRDEDGNTVEFTAGSFAFNATMSANPDLALKVSGQDLVGVGVQSTTLLGSQRIEVLLEPGGRSTTVRLHAGHIMDNFPKIPDSKINRDITTLPLLLRMTESPATGIDTRLSTRFLSDRNDLLDHGEAILNNGAIGPDDVSFRFKAAGDATPGAETVIRLEASAFGYDDFVKTDVVEIVARVKGAPPQEVQPDLQIRAAGEEEFAGVDTTGLPEQTVTLVTPENFTTRYQVRLVNQGQEANAFRLRASGEIPSGYQVRYRSSNDDITSEIRGGGFQSRSLGPGENHDITVEITPRAGVEKPDSITQLVQVSSLDDDNTLDVVRVVGQSTLTVNTTKDVVASGAQNGVFDSDPETPGQQISFADALRLADEHPSHSLVGFDLPVDGDAVPTITLDANRFLNVSGEISLGGGLQPETGQVRILRQREPGFETRFLTVSNHIDIDGIIFEKIGLAVSGVLRIDNSQIIGHAGDGLISTGDGLLMRNVIIKDNDGVGLRAENDVEIVDGEVSLNDRGGIIVGGDLQIEGTKVHANGGSSEIRPSEGNGIRVVRGEFQAERIEVTNNGRHGIVLQRQAAPLPEQPNDDNGNGDGGGSDNSEDNSGGPVTEVPGGGTETPNPVFPRFERRHTIVDSKIEANDDLGILSVDHIEIQQTKVTANDGGGVRAFAAAKFVESEVNENGQNGLGALDEVLPGISTGGDLILVDTDVLGNFSHGIQLGGSVLEVLSTSGDLLASSNNNGFGLITQGDVQLIGNTTLALNANLDGGIKADGPLAVNVRLNVAGSGVEDDNTTGHGILVTDGDLILDQRATIEDNGGDGILVQQGDLIAEDLNANENVRNGIFVQQGQAQLIKVNAKGNGGHGISVVGDLQAINVSADNNKLVGILIDSSASVQNPGVDLPDISNLENVGAVRNQLDGIQIIGGQLVADDLFADENGGNGVLVQGTATISRLDATDNAANGLHIEGHSNFLEPSLTLVAQGDGNELFGNGQFGISSIAVDVVAADVKIQQNELGGVLVENARLEIDGGTFEQNAGPDVVARELALQAVTIDRDAPSGAVPDVIVPGVNGIEEGHALQWQQTAFQQLDLQALPRPAGIPATAVFAQDTLLMTVALPEAGVTPEVAITAPRVLAGQTVFAELAGTLGGFGEFFFDGDVGATVVNEVARVRLGDGHATDLDATPGRIVTKLNIGGSQNDQDRDGLSDGDERDGPNGGDANSDGIPDLQQANVAAVRNAVDGRFIVLVAPAGSQLKNIRAVSPDQLPALPTDVGLAENIGLPAGVVRFDVLGVDAATAGDQQPAIVQLQLPQGPEPTGGVTHTAGLAPSVSILPESLADGVTLLTQTLQINVFDGGVIDNDGRENGVLSLSVGPLGTVVDPPLSGDVDGDGEVGFSDFLRLSQNFGRQDATGEDDGDLNGDGEVGFADFLILAQNFGRRS